MRQRTKYSTFTRAATVAAQLVGACCLATNALQAPAFASQANPSFLVLADASKLAPGAYLWNPSIAPSGPMSMVIDLTSQRAAVYRNGMLIGITTISSGKPGYETPDGIFTVLEKQKDHHSNKYDDAPMPYMQRLTEDGLALHAGNARGYPASHGCIRLPMGFAAALFKENTRGMQVVITGHAPGKSQTLIANRQSGRTKSQIVDRTNSTDNLQATKYWNGQGDSNATPEQPCCAPVAGGSEADDQTGNGADSRDVNPSAGEDVERSPESSPQDVPSPPG